MPTTQTSVTTANASRYLQQLSKHFGHKVPVEFDARTASVGFPFGDCRMWADDSTLTIKLTSDSTETLTRVQLVVHDHLARFAWREQPEIVWSQPA